MKLKQIKSSLEYLVAIMNTLMDVKYAVCMFK
jgi:hypothetical protein